MADDTPQTSSAEDDLPVESLIQGRAKRSTAGLHMSALLDAAADDDLALLFEEIEDDNEFADEVDPDAEDDMGMDSSSDDDDDNARGDELEGEQELQKEERAEKKKRRAQQDLRFKIVSKKVKIDPMAVDLSEAGSEASASGAGTGASRPKKKSERISWIPTPEEGPTRSSSRRQTMQNKELTHARLKDSEEKRIRLIATMEEAAKRKARFKPKEMTQAERLAEAERVERHNSKSLNRWEEMEKRKAEERKAKIEALQNRRLEGPVMSYWSGLATWTNGKLTRIGKVEVKPKPEKEEPVRKKSKKTEKDEKKEETEKGTTEGGTASVPPQSVTPAPQPPADSAPAAEDASKNKGQDQEQLPDAPQEGGPQASSTAEDAADKTTSEGHTVSTTPVPGKAPTPTPDDLTQKETTPKETTPKTMSEGNAEQPTTTQSADYETSKDIRPEPMDIDEKPETPKESTPAAKDDTSKPSSEAPMAGSKTATAEDAAETEGIAKEPTRESSATAPPVPESSVQLMEIEKSDKGKKESVSEPALATTAETKATTQSDAVNEATKEPSPKPTESAPPVPEDSVASPAVSPTALPVCPDASAPAKANQPGDTPAQTQEGKGTPDVYTDQPAVPKEEEAQPEIPQPPPVIEQTGRNVTVLENFDDKTAQSREFSIYFNAKKPPRLTKISSSLCVITSLPSRYKDPETSLPFANAYAYQQIREAVAQKYTWSSMLGCYIGPAGVAASGVPARFLDPNAPPEPKEPEKKDGPEPSTSEKEKEKEKEKEQEKKSDSQNPAASAPTPIPAETDGKPASVPAATPTPVASGAETDSMDIDKP